MGTASGEASDVDAGITAAVDFRGARWWMLGLFLAAALPRLVGLKAGLPLVLNPDELMSLGFARAIDVSGDLRGQPWRYPPLLGDVMYGLMVVLRGVGGCEGACSDPQVLTLGRVVSVLASSLGVVAIFAASRMAGVPRSWSALGALVLAWSPTFLFMGRYATPDALATGGVCASVMCLVAIAGGRGRGWYVAAALALGITGGAKYNAGLVAVSVVIAHFASPKRRAWLPWMLLTALGAFGVFVVTLLPP
ncbi:MAG: ArnT family glycosyltransferase, partial [Nannocystaceae bacterium]